MPLLIEVLRLRECDSRRFSGAPDTSAIHLQDPSPLVHGGMPLSASQHGSTAVIKHAKPMQTNIITRAFLKTTQPQHKSTNRVSVPCSLLELHNRMTRIANPNPWDAIYDPGRRRNFNSHSSSSVLTAHQMTTPYQIGLVSFPMSPVPCLILSSG